MAPLRRLPFRYVGPRTRASPPSIQSELNKAVAFVHDVTRRVDQARHRRARGSRVESLIKPDQSSSLTRRHSLPHRVAVPGSCRDCSRGMNVSSQTVPRRSLLATADIWPPSLTPVSPAQPTALAAPVVAASRDSTARPESRRECQTTRCRFQCRKTRAQA
jgi:hypothetical protein